MGRLPLPLHISSVGEELIRLLDEIINEERSFRASLNEMEKDHFYLEETHELMADRLDRKIDEHRRLREVHEAMFKVHRKIKKEHELALQRCYLVSERVKGGYYSDRETAMEIARLRDVLSRIREEHASMRQEREKIIAEHEALVRSLGDSSQATEH
jgi:hypothetical protein